MLIKNEEEILSLLENIKKESAKLPKKFLQNEAFYIMRCGDFAKVFFEQFLKPQEKQLFIDNAYELLLSMCITDKIDYNEIKSLKKSKQSSSYCNIKDAMTKMIIEEIYANYYDFLAASLILFLTNEDNNLLAKLERDLKLLER